MIAITRDVSPSLAGCELSFVSRTAIDMDRAGNGTQFRLQSG